MSNTYKEGNTTVPSNFRTVDITHKPRRTQHQNLRENVGLGTGAENAFTVEEQQKRQPKSVIQGGVTLEKAIKYFESHAEEEFAPLYTQTVAWLRELFENRKSAMAGEEEEDEDYI